MRRNADELEDIANEVIEFLNSKELTKLEAIIVVAFVRLYIVDSFNGYLIKKQ